ncbi:MAG: MBL fold metallo-hydrolase [Clostridia bacterium]|nr:MBL fold metallo-hydrolase [Clostridia bacterium]
MGRKSRKKAQKRLKRKIITTLIGIIIALIALAIAYFMGGSDEEKPPENYDIPEGSIEYHFIDIGQGDATLIMVDEKAILIDTGDRGSDDRKKLTDYLDKMNITELEYFIATHPDADHIGSAAYVVENYDIKNVILSPKEHTTQTYTSFIEAIEAKEQINVIVADQDEIGKKYNVGELEMTILGPLDTEDYSSKDMNNPSVVIMARWGNTKVLLTGDAEKEAELKLVEKYGASLDCDVLKVGHHGSDSSTHSADPENGIANGFLHYVKPEIAIISCGTGNKYEHPHQVTLDELAKYNVEVHRTDHEGSIVLVSDGTNITLKEAK